MKALPSVRELLAQSITQYRAQWPALAPLILLYLPISQIDNVLEWLGQSQASWFLLANQWVQLVTLFLSSWVYVAIIYQVTSGQSHLKKSILARAWPLAPTYFLLTGVIAILFLGSFIFFLIPAILVSLWFSLAGLVCVLENRGVRASLAR